jgi:glycosyltransferase involved in cell wall biosynthesis
MSIKVVILFANFGPYHIARLEGLISEPQSSQYEIFALELSRSQELYPWQIDLEQCKFSLQSVIKDKSIEKTNIIKLLWRLHRLLQQINPDVIAISGYFEFPMLFALIWCVLHQKRAILFSETTEKDAQRIWWRELLKKLIIKQYQAALVGGYPHHRYMVKLGMSPTAIFPGYDVVGNQDFCPSKIKYLPSPLPVSYFLAINRFVPKKNLLFLLSSYAKYLEANPRIPWHLVICGDGELRGQIHEKITKLELRDYIHLPGFLQQQQLLPYFAHAGCFIHASIQEQWGLVVNEAMAAALPVLVSNRCGCFEDLIIEGINGFGFDPENQQELTDLMLKISSGKMDLDRMGEASLNHIQKYSPRYFAQGLQKAIEYALNS